MNPAAKTVNVLIVDDNPLIRELMAQALDPLCKVIIASDGADALLKAVDAPPDLIITDFKMPGLDGRQLYDKLRHREATRNTPFIFVAAQGDIEEKLRPLVAAEDFLAKPFFVADLVRLAKKFVDRLHLEKLQQRASRPGVIQGRLEEMGVAELMQSLEMGQKSCRLALHRGKQTCELYFSSGQVKDARLGKLEGDAAVYEAVNWTDGEFEIDFSASSDRSNTTRSTTGLLMEAMRLMDEANSNSVKS
jgi:CheY-like chemotaxis protein